MNVELALKVFEDLAYDIEDNNKCSSFYYEFIPENLIKEADNNTTIIETLFEEIYEINDIYLNLNKGSINVLNSKTNKFELIVFEIVPVIRLNGIVFELNSEVYNLNNVI